MWSGSDGEYQILSDGTLQAQYRSSGILEFWQRADGQRVAAAPAPVREIKVTPRPPPPSQQMRPIKVVFRHIEALSWMDSRKMLWHWGLGIQDSIYEVAGLMAVIGPRGLVHATGAFYPFMNDGSILQTRLTQFDGYVEMDRQGTALTDHQIEQFIRQWVQSHPVYNAFTCNCQHFAADLYSHLTGTQLGFSKVGDFHHGPEASANVVWLKQDNKHQIVTAAQVPAASASPVTSNCASQREGVWDGEKVIHNTADNDSSDEECVLM